MGKPRKCKRCLTPLAGGCACSRAKKTITFSELRRLSVVNSKKLPQHVNVGGIRRQWVGIGWIECREEPKPIDPVVVED